jgi:pimeloyl-ACP methyl ester carboxylesterase
MDFKGTQVAYMAAGTGETVLLLHSSGASGAQWRALAEILRDRYRVLAPDLYGYGGTGQLLGPVSPGLSDAAALVDAVLSNGTGRVHLVGHSYGGAAALRWAADRPERLLSLTLIEPVSFHMLAHVPNGSAEQALFREVAALAADVTRSAAAGDGRSGMARFIDYWSGAGAWARLRPELQSSLALQIARVAHDFRDTMTDPTRIETLRKIDAPTLVLRGSESPQPARRIAALLAQILPNARLQTIPAAGHMLPLTHTAAVNAAIVDHLPQSTAAHWRPAAA